MSTALAATSLIMGLAGGAHCAAMCAAPCTGIVRGAGARGAAWFFHTGRLAGYMAAGAAAGGAMESVAWLAARAPVLKPAWMLVHLAVLGWGLSLAVLARQPAWAGAAGRAAWRRMQPLARHGGGVFATGMLWALVPCGLLYSALLVAALSGDAARGALSMGLFAAGSGVWLVLAPFLAGHVRAAANRVRQDLGTRLGGAALAGVSVWALAHDWLERAVQWCVS